MADTRRELQFAVTSDVDLDVDKPARGLEDLGDAADAAGKSLDRLDEKAEDTARGVDGSLEKIAASARSNLKKVDDDTEKAARGLDDFKDEAASSGREAAASFSGGFEDITDTIQEIGANAFAGFGPAGAAAGIAAAAGIGFLSSALQKSADEANATKDRVIELAQAIDEAGGNLEDVDLTAMLRDWSREIADNKSWWELWQESNTTNLEKVRDLAKKTGVDFKELFAGIAGTDPFAAKRALDSLNDALAENSRHARDAKRQYENNVEGASRLISSYADQRRAIEEAKDSLLKNSAATEDAINLAALQAEALGRTQKAEDDAKAALGAHADALASFTDPVSVYTELLATKEAAEQASAQKTAAATKDQKDSWEDYAKSVTVSVDEYLDQLAKQVEAQEAWASNMATLAKRGVDDGVLSELERLGPEGAPLIAQLSKASDAELNRMTDLFARRGATAGDAYARNLRGQTADVVASAAALHSGAARVLGGQITIPIGFEKRWSMTDLQRLKYDIQNQIGTIVIPVKAGQSPYANTTNNSRYRN